MCSETLDAEEDLVYLTTIQFVSLGTSDCSVPPSWASLTPPLPCPEEVSTQGVGSQHHNMTNIKI